MEDLMNQPDCSPDKTLLTKWLRILLYCQMGILAAAALGPVPVAGTLAGWLSRIISVAVIVSLVRLAPVNGRYRKAALFYGISLGGSILSALLKRNIFAMILSVCSIVAVYQEFSAHAEITAPKDAVLSRRWHSLFYWQLVVGLVSGFLSSAGAVIGVLAQVDPDTIVTLALVFTALVSVALGLVQILYLKKTLALYTD